MTAKDITVWSGVILLAACQGGGTMEDATASGQSQVSLTPIERLGKLIFFDKNLSDPPGQSCGSCHGIEVGFSGPISEMNARGATYEGAVQGRFGNRKPPSAAYASFSPGLHIEIEEEEGESEETLFVGGQFWDGRADDLAEQAKGPFLNPLEQNGPNARYICLQVQDSEYADLFEEVFGPGSINVSDQVDRTYQYIAEAIAAYEASGEVNPFTSKYDYYLAGRAELTPQEAFGLELFEDEDKGNCAACHPSRPAPDGTPPLFTDFTYDNLGIPRNPENRFYKMPAEFNPAGENWVDLGLGAIVGMAGEIGKVKVPTLRNVDMRPDSDFVKAYGHNGFFKSLEDIVRFYNTRDTEDWPPPEVPVNVNTEELGDLGLTAEEEAAIVAFMKTLTDGYIPPD